MKKNIGLVFVALICTMLLSACGKEVVATTDPVPTEPAVTTTSAEEAITEAPKPEVKTEVEDVKPTEEVKDEQPTTDFGDVITNYPIDDFVRDGVFYYQDYAKSIGDADITLIYGKDKDVYPESRGGVMLTIGDWYIEVSSSAYSNDYSFLLIGNSKTNSGAYALPLEFDSNVVLYDDNEAFIPASSLKAIPQLVEYCKTHDYSSDVPGIFSGWTPIKELIAKYPDPVPRKRSGNPGGEVVVGKPNEKPTPSVDDKPADNYSTVIEKYIADGDFSMDDAKAYTKEIGGTACDYNYISILMDVNGYGVELGSSGQDATYAYVAVDPYNGGGNTYSCIYNWTQSTDNVGMVSNTQAPRQAFLDFEKTINYIKAGNTPYDKPSINGMNWIGWDEW